MTSAYAAAATCASRIVANDPPIIGVDDVIRTLDRNDSDGGSVGFAVHGPFNWIDLRRPQIYAGLGRMFGW
jgi:hypothetical protein